MRHAVISSLSSNLTIVALSGACSGKVIIGEAG